MPDEPGVALDDVRIVALAGVVVVQLVVLVRPGVGCSQSSQSR
jgi:hypothetical protein